MSADQVTVVEDILKQAAEQDQAALKSISVVKEVPVSFDLGNVLLSDPNVLDAAAFRSAPHAYLDRLARDNAQLLVNEIWKQERIHVDGETVAKLPAPTTLLPRFKAIPTPKPPTKWETFAAKKGIQKKKKEKLVFDEESGEWRPRFGFRSKDNQMQDWCVEAKGDDEDPEEAFGRNKKEKRERTARNEYQRLKNLARAAGKPAPANNAAAVVPEEAHLVREDTRRRPEPSDLSQAAVLAKASTASLGKFQEAAVNEKPVKGQGGKKRHFEPNEADLTEEKDKNLKLVQEVLSKKPKVDIRKAIVNHNIVSCSLCVSHPFYLTNAWRVRQMVLCS